MRIRTTVRLAGAGFAPNARLLTRVLAAMLVASGVAAAQQVPSESLTNGEIAAFLARARIVSSKGLDKGVTHPTRVTLSDGTITHDAVFSSVDEHTAVMRFASGRTELDFIDSYKYTLAAYGLARLLGLDDMMPVTIERSWRGDQGALSWWIDARMDEAQRVRQQMRPPDTEAWNRQMARMRVFAQLVADTDRNAGNVLIGPDWKVWMIDFTRAFRRTKQLLAPGDLSRCDRDLLARLRVLTQEQVQAATRPYIGDAQVKALVARRDAIVTLFDQRVAEKGEARVLY